MGNILEIKKYPDKTLRQRSQPIKEITQREIKLWQDMLATMRQASGIGLAAPQVGISKRLIVVDLGEGSLKLANPEVIEARGKDKMEEGCLSVAGALVNVRRPTEVIVKGLNHKGEIVEVKARGLLARAILHEIDHLNGKLIVDYMNFLQKLDFKLNGKRRSRCSRSKGL